MKKKCDDSNNQNQIHDQLITDDDINDDANEEISANITTPAITNASSIFKQSRFPSKTKKYAFTPKQLHDALTTFSDNTTPLNDHLESRGITVDTFFRLVRDYPEINVALARAWQIKGSAYNSQSVEIYTATAPPKWCYDTDKSGNEKISMAGVKYLSDRHRMLTRQATIHDRERYGEKQEVISHNTNISEINITLPDIRKLHEMDITELTEIDVGDS